MNKDLVVVNLLGTSGVGKSRLASALFSNMINIPYTVELISEVAKQMVWEQCASHHFENQVKISAEQYSKQLYLRQNNIDICITDSPLILGLLHKPEQYFEHYEPLLFEMFNSFTNINFLIQRSDFKYEQKGRNETLEESNKKQDALIKLLDDHKVNYQPITNISVNGTANNIAFQVLQYMQELRSL